MTYSIPSSLGPFGFEAKDFTSWEMSVVVASSNLIDILLAIKKHTQHKVGDKWPMMIAHFLVGKIIEEIFF